MISVGEAATQLGESYHWVSRWVKKKNLGQKCGWGVVLSEDDVKTLKTCGRLGNNHGNEKIAQNPSADHAII